LLYGNFIIYIVDVRAAPWH